MSNDLQDLWNSVLESLQQQLPQDSYEAWLESTKPLGLYGDTMVVSVVNEFARNWLRSRYEKTLKGTLSEIAGRDIILKFVVPRTDAISHAETASTAPMSVEPTSESGSIGVITPADVVGQALNPKYTFDSFVIGNSNRFAHAAAIAVSDRPSQAYNPLFLYGGVGLGKTHLMQAVGHRVLSQRPDYKIAYISSETFTNEMISSIHNNTTFEFRNKYRTIDVLLIDDIQFVAGKEGTQEEFFHTFNALHEANRQIVISSDRPPKEITSLEERLRSRFEWGLICDIQPPDFETRVAILRKKAELEGLLVPDDVLSFMANKIDTNIRELEGALIRVIAYASLVDSEITKELSQEALKDILPAAKSQPVTIPLIQRIVANWFDLGVQDMKGKSRARSISYPRQIAMYFSRELTDSSLPQIGDEFGGRDHTTVMHAHEKISTLKGSDREVLVLLSEIEKRLRNH